MYTRENWQAGCVELFSTLKDVEKELDNLVASAVYIALINTEERSLEANRLLAYVKAWRKSDAEKLADFFTATGPFEIEEDKNVLMPDGTRSTLKRGLRFKERLLDANGLFQGKDPLDVYKDVYVRSYRAFKKAKVEKPEKTTEEKLTEALVKMDKFNITMEKDGVDIRAHQGAVPTTPANVATKPHSISELLTIMQTMIDDGMLPQKAVDKVLDAMSLLEIVAGLAKAA